MPEARALVEELRRRGISAFLCDIPPGQDIANAVVTALAHCKMAVILGTKTYGQKTSSGFSTFEELRYIFEVNKPLFAVKMCQRFEVAETTLRLPAHSMDHTWLPSSKEQRSQPPALMLERLVQKLEGATALSKDSSLPADSSWSSAPKAPRPQAEAESTPAEGAAVADPFADVGSWLARHGLGEFEAVLRELGAVDVRDIKVGFEEKELNVDMLASLGMNRLRSLRLQREAEKVGLWCVCVCVCVCVWCADLCY